jgi:hypothetical protein
MAPRTLERLLRDLQDGTENTSGNPKFYHLAEIRSRGEQWRDIHLLARAEYLDPSTSAERLCVLYSERTYLRARLAYITGEWFSFWATMIQDEVAAFEERLKLFKNVVDSARAREMEMRIVLVEELAEDWMMEILGGTKTDMRWFTRGVEKFKLSLGIGH